MSKYYWDKDNLWWQAIAVMFAATVCFVIIWCCFHPYKAPVGLDADKQSFIYGCNQHYGAPNVGSSNPKDWTCVK